MYVFWLTRTHLKNVTVAEKNYLSLQHYLSLVLLSIEPIKCLKIILILRESMFWRFLLPLPSIKYAVYDIYRTHIGWEFYVCRGTDF